MTSTAGGANAAQCYNNAGASVGSAPPAAGMGGEALVDVEGTAPLSSSRML